MKLKITLGLLFISFWVWAQNNQVNRDIEVAKKILEALVEEGEETFHSNNIYVFGSHARVKGSYVADYGAIFTIYSNSLGNAIYYEIENGEKVKRTMTLRSNGKKKSKTKIDSEDLEEYKAAAKEKFKSIAETFICDYGYLLRGLAANEKLIIRYDAKTMTGFENLQSLATWGNTRTIGSRHHRTNKYTATIAKAAIMDFQKERINQNQLKQKIKFVFEDTKESKEQYKDIDLFVSILKKVHPRVNDKWHIRNGSNYEKIEDIGVIFNFDIRSKNANALVIANGKTLGFRFPEEDILILDGDEERNITSTKKQKRGKIDLRAMYSTFLKEFKNNILDYGSIIKSLKDKEALIFKLNFPTCRDCDEKFEPLEITLKQTTLQAYKRENISLDEAVKQLKIK